MRICLPVSNIMRKLLIAALLYVVAFATAKAQIPPFISTAFENDNISLAGALYLPDSTTGKSFPTFIIAQRSGFFGNEYYQQFIQPLCKLGYAVFLFDKRGTGDSQGKFIPLSVKNSPEVFSQLASDLVAAYNHLKTLSQVDPNKIGFFGISQGGWIVPIAEQKLNGVYAVIILSGPTITVGQNFYYSKYSGEGRKKNKVNLEELTEKTKLYIENSGFDPAPYIKTFQSPALWIFGEKDRTIPAKYCIESLKTLFPSEKQQLLTSFLLPNATHDLLDESSGKNLNDFNLISEWLKKNFN